MDPNDVPKTNPLDDDEISSWDIPMASEDDAPQDSDNPMEKDGEEMPQP